MAQRLLHRLDEAAQLLGVSRSQIYKLSGRGEFEVVKIGRSALVTDESLRAFVERLRQSSSEAA